MTEKIQICDVSLREKLTPEQFRIAREHATEPPFTGEYYSTKTPGVYHCAVCSQPLFSSDHKFDSGTGWPSYFQAIEDSAVETQEDGSHGMVRTEVHCSRCDSHLGHVFPDGPKPTGQRYCINSAVLKLEPAEEA